MQFSYETHAGLRGTIQAPGLAEARNKLAEQFGGNTIESIEAIRDDGTAPAAGGWSAFWDRVRALPPRQ